MILFILHEPKKSGSSAKFHLHVPSTRSSSFSLLYSPVGDVRNTHFPAKKFFTCRFNRDLITEIHLAFKIFITIVISYINSDILPSSLQIMLNGHERSRYITTAITHWE